MKPANAQICSTCEELFVGDECPKCGDRNFSYLRRWFAPMHPFGGPKDDVILKDKVIDRDQWLARPDALPLEPLAQPCGRPDLRGRFHLDAASAGRIFRCVLPAQPAGPHADREAEPPAAVPGPCGDPGGKPLESPCSLLRWSGRTDAGDAGQRPDGRP